ncbi:MAG: adenylate/guanylate cyclase domain-containing protein [Candidatus Latescibacterota bacterium]|nr:adenylate/guanylate cyclase domain-containing protein [Candidatus Latescibacterota bacterium]
MDASDQIISELRKLNATLSDLTSHIGKMCSDVNTLSTGLNSIPQLPGSSVGTETSTDSTVPTAELASARKHVTVVFADISGFTAMSEKLDPEEVSTMMNDCLTQMADIVIGYQGHVDKFIGDCIMALFGAPVAHENDAELAVRAALDMNQAIIDYNRDLPIKLEKPLTLHTGINTGLVVAGNVGSGQKLEYTVMGDTVNLASRLESTASSGQVFISKYTHNQVKTIFNFSENDPIQVKGKKDPVPVYEVLGLRSAEERRSDLVALSTHELVGRDHEMNLIKKRIDQAFNKETQVALLKSDAGIGKSRIHKEIETYLTNKDVEVIYGRCHSFRQSSSYFLFIEILQDLFGIGSDDVPEAIPQKIVEGLTLLTGETPDILSDEGERAVVFLGHIMGVEFAEYDIPIGQMTDVDIKQSVLSGIRWLLEKMARTRPLILVLEDLHFADPESLDVISYLLKSVSNKAMMLLLYLRPEDTSPSSKLSLIARKELGDLYTEIELERFTSDESDRLVRSLLRSEKIPGEILNMVRERADGNPSFIEAIVQALHEEDVVEVKDGEPLTILKPIDSIEIPGSIQGLVVSCLDRLPSQQKRLLQWASVIGPVFEHALVEQVAEDQEPAKSLQELIDRKLIFESKSFPEIEYSFTSVLVQECSYSGLLLKQQREMHVSVAEAIGHIHKIRIDEHFDSLGQHSYKAGDFDQAYEYSVKAGMRAKGMHAPVEAISHLNPAIECVEKAKNPETPIWEVYQAIAEVYEVNGDLDLAIEWRGKLASLLKDERQKGDCLRQVGRIWEKKGDQERSLKMYSEAFEVLEKYPQSIEMGRTLLNESWVLNRQRQSEQAVAKCRKALELFERHESEEDIADAHNNLAVFYEHNGDLDLALEHNEKCRDLLVAGENSRKLGNAYLSLGYVHSKRKELSEALSCFEQAVETQEAIANRIGVATSLMAKGRCYLDLSDYGGAETTLRASRNIFRDAELGFRVVANNLSLARVYLESGETESASECLAEARVIASEQNRTADLARVSHLEALVLIKKGADPKEKFENAISEFESIGRAREAASVSDDYDSYKNDQTG